MGMRTPWGAAQTQHTIAPGIVEVSTAGHGGIHLSRTLNDKVHEAWRDPAGWYEEDSEWAIVAITFPDLPRWQRKMATGRCAGQTVLDYAHAVARDWHVDGYQAALGVTLTPADSRELADRALAASVVEQIRSCTAWGAGQDGNGRYRVPAGWVGVDACIGGRWRRHEQPLRHYLVTKTEYDERDRPGVSIDPGRHPQWHALPEEDPDHPVVVHVGFVGPSARDEFPLFGQASPHRGREVGSLWRYPATATQPERWRAYRRHGVGHGASPDSHPTREQALEAVGFAVPPYAKIPVDLLDPPEGD